jgi:hypothetical protein
MLITMVKKINSFVPAFREISAYTGVDDPTIHAVRKHSQVTVSVREEI